MSLAVWIQFTNVTDGRTDRRTDGRTDTDQQQRRRLRIASHGNKWYWRLRKGTEKSKI